jgi:hypothetical protein
MHQGKEILIIDYSGLNVDGMVALVAKLGKMIEAGGTAVLLLSIFTDANYATAKFMRQTEKETAKVNHLLAKQAIVGLNAPKRMILKGYNLLFDRNIKSFDNMEGALDFLADDSTTDKGNPWKEGKRIIL